MALRTRSRAGDATNREEERPQTGEGISGSFSNRDSGKDQQDPVRGFQVCVWTIPWGWGAQRGLRRGRVEGGEQWRDGHRGGQGLAGPGDLG